MKLCLSLWMEQDLLPPFPYFIVQMVNDYADMTSDIWEKSHISWHTVTERKLQNNIMNNTSSSSSSVATLIVVIHITEHGNISCKSTMINPKIIGIHKIKH